MLARTQPADAYREANFDARLMGGSRDDLVIFCIEDLIANRFCLTNFDQKRCAPFI